MRSIAIALSAFLLTLALAGCGDDKEVGSISNDWTGNEIKITALSDVIEWRLAVVLSVDAKGADPGVIRMPQRLFQTAVHFFELERLPALTVYGQRKGADLHAKGIIPLQV